MMAGLRPKLVSILHEKPPGGPYEFFSVACTEVNIYLAMKYFFNTDGNIMSFWKIWQRYGLTNPI